uniref:Cyclotide hyen-C n=1 Tax=Pigea enneasperma TaxID=212266 RepID=CYHEC_PIGEN|nr:RecName: Full=Cyclotide hyen-C [Pigea enneasperma]
GTHPCQETCVTSTRCSTQGCHCNWPICFKN